MLELNLRVVFRLIATLPKRNAPALNKLACGTAIGMGIFLLNLPIVTSQDAPEDVKSEPKKQYQEEFRPSFTDNPKEVPGLRIYGPDGPERVKYEGNAIRISLPTEYPRPRPGTGVVTDFGIKGDFEITASFEILKEPNAGLGGNPTDLKLMVVPNEPAEPEVWHRSNQDRAFVAREVSGRANLGGFMATATQWDPGNITYDKWGNANFNKIETQQSGKRVPAKAKTGRLRLARSGAELAFFWCDGESKDFTLQQNSEFGTKDLKNVRLIASTGSPGAALDIRIADLWIRADSFVKTTVAPLVPTEPEAPPARNRLPILIAIAVPVAGIALSLGIWLMMARRRRDAAAASAARKAAPNAGSTDPAGPIVFECSSCGTRLKVKAELAGGKVKCPKCGQAANVPNAKSGSEDLS